MSGSRIAVIGLACRVPGAPNPGRFWRMLRDGLEGIRRFTPAELSAAGVDAALSRRPDYVPACGALDGVEDFDAEFFGVPPREAEIMDPQHRIFLELAWEALEDAGYAGDRRPGRTGVYAGTGLSTYLLHNLLPSANLARFAAPVQLLLTNNKDSMPTRVSYRLDLRGPSLNISTACSTSLVAVHVACQALLHHECDVALAGGIGIQVPQDRGYLYEPDGILSPDGHCRAFDAAAAGTVSGNGGGIVVLKRVEDAEADRDAIRAVILGTAINNDGALKAGYTAPGLSGQMEVVAEALAMADVSPDDITYVESHGTGTSVGDPIEIRALTEVFRRRTARRQFCAIGSVKTNIGHLDEGAGVAGLIKTVLALEHRQIPASLHFTAPNPECHFESSPFYVNSVRRDWQSAGSLRRAGVSSFGIGGTNAHVVLEEAPETPRVASRAASLLTVSARSPTALESIAHALAARIDADPSIDLQDVAHTLQTGRRAFAHRRAIVCRDRIDALAQLGRRPSNVSGPAGERNVSESERHLRDLGARWESGAPVDWDSVPGHEQRRRVSLPTSPFGRQRYWIDPPSLRSSSRVLTGARVETWLYAPGWTIAPWTSTGAGSSGGVVLFVPEASRDRAPWVAALVAALSARCPGFVTVTPGANYRRHDSRTYEIRPGESADYDALLSDLSSGGRLPAAFVHLWQIAGSAAIDDETGLSRGFDSVLCLARAAGARLDVRQARLAVVTDAAQAVEPDDLVRPEQSAMGGLVRTIAVEYPTLACLHLDLDGRGPGAAVDIEEIAAELVDPAPGEIVVAHRGGRRLVPRIRAVTPTPDHRPALSLIRDGGVYLITGGLGSMGLALAEWIANRARVTLVLAARRPAAADSDHTLIEPDVAGGLDSSVQVLLDRLCGRLILDYVTGAGVDLHRGAKSDEDAVRAAAGVVPRYRKMLDWCLDVLREDGFIERRDGVLLGRWDGEGPTAAELAARIKDEAPGLSAVVDLLSRCAARYGDVLSGAVDGSEVLYPDGTPAWLDSGFAHSVPYAADRACLDALGRYIAAVADGTPGGPLRILEVGGGTGTLTEAIYRHLGDRPIEFTFSDVSLAFVAAAEAESRRRGLRSIVFRRLDISRPAADQEVAEQAYDVVLGYNVVHATPDVRQTLRHLRRLLVPGGNLCLVETVRTSRWDQMIWGLAKGWWEYADDRSGSPLLGLDAWERALRDAGFDRVDSTPRDAASRSRTDAGLIVGRVPGAPANTRSAVGRIAAIEASGSRVETAWVDVSDAAAVARLVADIRARHGRIAGVIHTAGVIGRGFIRNKTVPEARRVLAPKLGGARALEAALRDDPPDLFVVCSGLASRFPVAGQADYAAANAALDGFAHAYGRASGIRAISIGWGFWQELGLIEKSAMPRADQDRIAAEILENGWATAGVEAFETALSRCSGTEILIYPHGLPGAVSGGLDAGPVTPRHPLLADRRDEDAWTTYDVRFGPDTAWMLDEHRVDGHAVLPGTAYLELMRAAYVDVRGDDGGGIELRDVSFLRPFIAEPGRSPALRVVVRPRGDRTEALVISAAGHDRWTLHARADIADLQDDDRPGAVSGSAIGAGLSGAGAALPKGFADRMAGFGPRWDNVRAVRFSGDAATAELCLPARFESETGGLGLHPALLDNATGYLPVQRQTEPRAPFSHASVKVRGPLRGALISHATAHGAAGARDESFDVVIANHAGHVLVEVTGYRFRPLGARVTAIAPADDRDAVLRLGTRGSLETLSFAPASRRPPDDDEVEIRVEASGVNFIETLYALGMLPARDDRAFPFGLECAGTITRTGSGVSATRIGQRVAAFANGTDRLFVTVPARAVAVLPADITFDEAATIPAAYMTAYTALVDQGRLRPGERVLIHSACGGVGLAAVHVARWRGARILATAGTDEKRAYLRRMGIDAVMDSRSRAFAAATMTATGGAGVDIVLNSLAGDLIEAGLSVLAPGGRFLELGKRDILEGTPLSLSHFEQRRSFAAIDVGPDLPEFDRLWHDVWTRVLAGDFPPLPRRVFPATAAAAAVAEMARGRHVGKFVLSFVDREAIERQAASRPADRGQSLADILGLAVAPAPQAARIVEPARAGAPQNEIERAIAAMWADLLGGAPVGRDENFFELNGDSLIGAQVISRMHHVFAVKIPLSAIFDHPTVAELAALVRQAGGRAPGAAVAAAADDQMEEGVV